MADQIETLDMFGIPISNVTFGQVCTLVAQRIAGREPGYVVTPNVNHVCLCHRDSEFREAYMQSFLSLPDGVPIIWASRLFGIPLVEKLSGSDMVPKLSRFAAERGFSVFFLGGMPGTAERTAEILRQKNPALRVAGCYCPPFGFEQNPVEMDKAIEAIRTSNADICFVALGSPKQERFMRDTYQRTGVPVSIGIGGSFDFISGRVRRAPAWMQQLGLEWVWRLSMEPRRLWKRYLLQDTMFFRLLWNEYFVQRRRRAARSMP